MTTLILTLPVSHTLFRSQVPTLSCSMHSTLFALLVTLLLASSAPVRAISTQCRGRNPGLGDDCSNSWDRVRYSFV